MMTVSAKRVTAVLFLLFLLLFPKFSPFVATAASNDNSLIHTIFNLYFFIVNQTLGMIHEAGHGVCYILHCPQLQSIANGTIFQLLFPTFVALYYRKRNNPFAAAIALFFVGFSLQYTSWYMSTAQESAIVPASKSFLGVDGLHDFHYIFSAFHILSHTAFISGASKLVAYMLMFYSTGAMLKMAFIDNDNTPSKVNHKKTV